MMGPRSSAQAEPERGSPSLQVLCETCVAGALLEPRSCLQLLQFADAAGARALFRSAMTVRTRLARLVLACAQSSTAASRGRGVLSRPALPVRAAGLSVLACA